MLTLTLHVPEVASYYRSQNNDELPNYKPKAGEDKQSYQKRLLDELAKFVRPDAKAQPGFDETSLKYAISGDNLLKMLLIYSRVAVNLPVVIMGETGCGKTR